MPTTRLSGIDLYYECAGSGPRVLFLNGSGSTLADVTFLLDRLRKDLQVAAFDQRGLGRSGPAGGPYSMAELSADAVALADHLGWERFAVLGVSFGGMVAQEVAVTVPDRIERLALLCTSSGGAGGSSYPLHTLTELDPAERTRHYLGIVDTRLAAEPSAAGTFDQVIAEQAASRLTADRPPAVLEGEALQARARAGHDVYARLPHITCPTLVASGRFDGIAPPENGAAIARQIPGAEVRLFEGGHLFFLQDAQALPAVTGFLAEGTEGH